MCSWGFLKWFGMYPWSHILLYIADRTPVCKVVLTSAVSSSLLLNFPLRQYRPYFVNDPAAVFERHQVCGSLLIPFEPPS